MTFISAKMANVENFGWRWWQRCYEISRDAVREISRLSASIPVDRRFVRLFSLSLSIPLFFSLGSLVILGIYFFARRSPTRRLVGCAHNEITARVSCAKTRFYAQLLGRGQEYPRKIIPSSVILTHTRLKIVWLTSDDGTRVREREREIVWLRVEQSQTTLFFNTTRIYKICRNDSFQILFFSFFFFLELGSCARKLKVLCHSFNLLLRSIADRSNLS